MKIGIQSGSSMELARIVDKLLFLKRDAGALRETVRQFYDLLSEDTGFNDCSIYAADNDEKNLKSGKAISPKNAASCVLDMPRTSKFMRGIYAAILKLKKEFSGTKIEILYAGCGPFAALALPQCAIFGADEMSWTLIDIHERSIDSAKQLFIKYGFLDRVCEFIVADASTFQDVSGKRFHLIISETMQKALEKEPQAAITQNLANQLVKNGIFIPQKITISACLANLQNEFGQGTASQRIPLGTILELSTESADIFAPKTIKIPYVETDGMDLMLLTEIQVFEDISLREYESGITHPTVLHDLPKMHNGETIEFRYELAENPGFRYKIIPEAISRNY